MAEQQDNTGQIQFLLADFNTRLRDLEERNKILKEKSLLLAQNLLSIKSDTDNDLQNNKKTLNQLKKEVAKTSSITKNILAETKKYSRKDEMLVVERMLKDFQPLEFMRKKDVEELIREKLAPKKAVVKKLIKNNN